MSFLDGKTFEVTPEISTALKRIHKMLGCLLCGNAFKVGEQARFVFANCADAPFKYGNFFVCTNCDAGACDTSSNPILLKRAAELADEMVQHLELVKRIADSRLYA
jgi:hypothetical protein